MPKKGSESVVKKGAKYIEKLAGGNKTVIGEKPAGKSVNIVTQIAEVYLPLGELIDTEKEKERIKKELETVESEIARASGKLNNAGFAAKAPAHLIEEERAKLAKYTALKADLQSKFESL